MNNVIFEDEYFEFVRTEGIGISNTPWSGLAVITKRGSIAEKHAVEIRLNNSNNPDYNGEPVEYTYRDCYIAHGMRSTMDSLDDTRECIDVLEDAVDFAEAINKWLLTNK